MQFLFADCCLDTDRQEFWKGGKPVSLEPQVYELLRILIENRDRVVEKDELIERIWGGRFIADATVSVRVSAARQAVGDNGKAQAIIRTITKRGFRFVADIQSSSNDQAETAAGHAGPTNESADSERPTLAVLPFANRSPDPEQEYFSDGVTEDIITRLSKFHVLFVISRGSTFYYKNRSVRIAEIAQDLSAQYILEGSVQRAGENVRVTTQLVDVATDRHVWADRFDCTFTDLFETQDVIAERIAAAAAPEYFSAEIRRARRKPSQSVDAWDAFMRGYWRQLRYTKADNVEAQRLFRKALELDPQLANALALLGMTELMDALYGWSASREESMRAAREHTTQALAIDAGDGMVVRARGIVHLFSKEHFEALADFERAVEINPNDAESVALLGAAHGAFGNYETAKQKFGEALKLSPRDLHVATWFNYLSMAATAASQYSEAKAWAEKAIEANATFPGGYRSLAAACGNLGETEVAKAAAGTLCELQPGATLATLRETIPFFRADDDLERYLSGLEKAELPAH